MSDRCDKLKKSTEKHPHWNKMPTFGEKFKTEQVWQVLED